MLSIGAVNTTQVPVSSYGTYSTVYIIIVYYNYYNTTTTAAAAAAAANIITIGKRCPKNTVLVKLKAVKNADR